MKTPRTALPVILSGTLFVVCILFAYCWFNTDIGRSVLPSFGPSVSPPRIFLTARTNLAGYTFVSEPVSDSVKETLGTTNIVSGNFYKIAADGNQTTRVGDANLVLTSDIRPPPSVLRPLASDRITVFLATWSPESKKPLLMLGHTPDICWTGAGWKPVELGQPRQVLIDLPLAEEQRPEDRGLRVEVRSQRPKTRTQESEPSSDLRHPTSRPDLRPPSFGRAISELPSPNSQTTLPFSCRAFESPDRTTRELAVWCTLIDGQPLTDSIPSGRETVPSSSPDARGRLGILDRLLRATRQRLPVRGEKQFVRYSMPMNGDWQMTLEQSKSLVPFHLQSEFANKTPI